MRQGGTSIFDVFPRLQNQPGWPRLGSLEFMKLGQAVLSLQRGLLEIELKDSSLKRVLFSSSSKSSRLASRVMVATTLAGKGKFLEAKQFPDVRSQFQVISPTCPSTSTRGLGRKLPEKSISVFKHVLALPKTSHFTGNFRCVPGNGEV